MKQVLSVIFLLIFTSEISIAAVTPKEELKQILSELEFGLKVEWDQKDKAFAENKMNEFNEKLKVLYKNGLKKDDLWTVAKDSKNLNLQNEMNLIENQLDVSKLNFEETRQILKDSYQKSLQQGASWNGDIEGAVMLAVFGGLILTVIALAVISDYNCKKNPGSCQSSGDSSSSDDDDWDNDDWDDSDWDDDDYWCEDEYVCDYYDDGYSYCYTTSYCY